ncbi:MAG: NUDIX hydrolase [Ktedonobacterales bacterium]
MADAWQVVASRVTYQDHWLKVRTDDCLMGDGTAVESYHVLEYPTWVNVVALTNDGQLVLVREYRHGAGRVVVGLPAGSVESGDADPMVAIRRELREETGYTAAQFFQTGRTYANAANQNNMVYSFLATGLDMAEEQSLDRTEDIEVIHEDFVALAKQVGDGELQMQAVHIAALHFAIRFICLSRMPSLANIRNTLRRGLFDVAS